MSAAVSGRESLNSQLEHLQSKYVGTGHSDSTKYEWSLNVKRDSNASYLSHITMLSLFSIAENEAMGRVKYNLLTEMINPCGPAPKNEDEEMKDED